MNELLRVTFKSSMNYAHRVSVWDRLANEDHVYKQITTEKPNYTISSNAGITDVVQGGMVPSELELYLINQGWQQIVKNGDFEADGAEWQEVIFEGSASVNYIDTDTPWPSKKTLRWQVNSLPDSAEQQRMVQEFPGAGLTPGKKYRITFYAKTNTVSTHVTVVDSVSVANSALKEEVQLTNAWEKYTLDWTADENSDGLRLFLGHAEDVYFISGIQLHEHAPQKLIILDLIQQIKENQDDKYLISIERRKSQGSEQYAPFWRGLVLQDFGDLSDSVYQSIRLKAVDALGLLKEMDYQTGESLMHHIIKPLADLPTADFYGPDTIFLASKINWFAEDAAGGCPLYDALLHPTQSEVLWSNISEKDVGGGETIEIEENSTAFEVIDHILTRFRAQLVMVHGIWVIRQPDDPILGDYRWFTKTVEQKPDIYTYPYESLLVDKENAFRSNVQFSHLPAVGRAEVFFLTKNDGSLIPQSIMPFPEGESVTYITQRVNGGNFRRLEIDFVWWILFQLGTLLDVSVGRKTAVFDIQFKLLGDSQDYYLHFHPYTWATSWQTTAPAAGYTRRMEISTGSSQITWNSNRAIGSWKQVTADIPDSGNVEVQIRFTEMRCTWGNESHVERVAPAHSKSQTMLRYLEDGEPQESVKFVAENTPWTLGHKYEDSLFGSSGNSATPGMLGVRTAAGEKFEKQSTWRQRTDTNYTQFLNELLVNETISQQSDYKLIMNGDVINRNSTHLADHFQIIRIHYKGEEVLLYPNLVEYNASTEELKGDWFEFFRTALRNATIDIGESTFENISTLTARQFSEQRRLLTPTAGTVRVSEFEMEGEPGTWEEVELDEEYLSLNGNYGIRIQGNEIIIEGFQDWFNMNLFVSWRWLGTPGVSNTLRGGKVLRYDEDTEEFVELVAPRFEKKERLQDPCCISNEANGLVEVRDGDRFKIAVYRSTTNLEIGAQGAIFEETPDAVRLTMISAGYNKIL